MARPTGRDLRTELIDEGIVTPENIDVGMRLGLGWNIGPFEIADNAGLEGAIWVKRVEEADGATGLNASNGELVDLATVLEGAEAPEGPGRAGT